MLTKELDRIKLADLWKGVKDEETLWGDLKQEARIALKTLMEASLLVCATNHLGAAAYERISLRRDYRNGYYKRSLETAFGLIEQILVPRCRKSRYAQMVFDSYKHRHKEVDSLVKEMFLAGVSTRRIGEVLEPVLGFSISQQTVSNILKALGPKVEEFHQRALCDNYLYLFFDAVVLKAKSVLEVKKRFVLCSYGITLEGRRELIDFRQASSESEAAWSAFLSSLYQRGLKALPTELITVDGCPGLSKALDLIYPFMARQRCWVHKLRNVSGYLPRRIQKKCLSEAKTIYLSSSRREAKERFRAWEENWQREAPKAVKCLRKDLDELLVFLECPQQHWAMIRTTNYIERAFREVRRRTRPISTFTNTASCERIIYGIICYLNSKWEDRRLKEFTQSG